MMKIVTVIVGILFYSLSALSQTITLKEMITNVNCSDYSCFNNFITQKGFSEIKKDPKREEIKFYYVYRSDSTFTASSNSKVVGRNDVIFSLHNGDLFRCNFRTVVNSQYKSLSDELAGLNFKSYETTDNGEGKTEVQYKSVSYPKLVVFVRTSNEFRKSDNESYLFYQIEVWRYQN